jgi:mannose-1-phosphate guanylyltransferase
MFIHREYNFAQLAANAVANRVALLLAGGDGTRLQDLTREIEGTPIPKQYCRIWHGASLLEKTVSRAQLFAAPGRINVVVNQNHLPFAKGQLSALPQSSILVQPANKDTGPGMVLSLLKLQRSYPDAIVAAFPTDHFVDDIAILGILPDRPETGYGYVLPSDPQRIFEKAYNVEAFVEKPAFGKACEIIAQGGLWNTFVMVFRISRMLESTPLQQDVQIAGGSRGST